MLHCSPYYITSGFSPHARDAPFHLFNHESNVTWAGEGQNTMGMLAMNIKRISITAMVSSIQRIITASVLALILTGSGFIDAPSHSANRDWFKALQNAIVSIEDGENVSVIDRVVADTLDSGVQVYVVIQTTMSIDENSINPVLKSLTRVTRDPAGVVKAAFLANIPINTVLQAVLSASVETETIIAAAITAGAPIETVMTTSLKAGAPPMLVVSSSIASNKNISGVIEASVKTGVPPSAILQAALSRNIKDLGQVVSAYINAGGDVYGITAAGIDIGADECSIITSSLGSSNAYYQTVKAALDLNVSDKGIMDCASKDPSIDKQALANAIETAKAALAYTPPDESRSRYRRDSIDREKRRGNVSVY